MKRLIVLMAAGVWAAEALTIEELLASVDRAFPLIEAVVAERRLAEGAAMSARGEFDLKLKGQAESQQFGFYRNESVKGFSGTEYDAMGHDGLWRLSRGSGDVWTL